MFGAAKQDGRCCGGKSAGDRGVPEIDGFHGIQTVFRRLRMYLIQLADRVARGLSRIPAERIERHRGFLLTQQMSSGGFRGREGDADLYYTGFAVRAPGEYRRLRWRR